MTGQVGLGESGRGEVPADITEQGTGAYFGIKLAVEDLNKQGSIYKEAMR